jgi:hypothetical protein
LPFFVLVTPVTRTKNGYQVKIEELYSRKDVPYFWSSAAVDIAIVQCTYAACRCAWEGIDQFPAGPVIETRFEELQFYQFRSRPFSSESNYIAGQIMDAPGDSCAINNIIPHSPDAE